MATKKTTKKKQVKRKTKKASSDHEALFYIYNLIIITVATIGALNVGSVGNFLFNCVRFIFGELAMVVFGLIIVGSIYFAIKKTFKALLNRYFIACIVLFLVILCLLTSTNDQNLIGKSVIDHYLANKGAYFDGTFLAHGGFIGAGLFAGLSTLFGKSGTYVVLVSITLIVLLLTLTKEGRQKLLHILGSPVRLIQKVRDRPDTKNIEETPYVEPLDYVENPQPEEDYADLLYEPEELAIQDNFEPVSKSPFIIDVDEVSGKPQAQVVEEHVTSTSSSADDTNALTSSTNIPYVNEMKRYFLPRINLLNTPSKTSRSSTNIATANESGKKLIHILEQFGVNASLVATHIGPSVTKFELKPEVGVRVNKISNLQQDIKMGLAAKEIRIEAPIPGKSSVGIEIPNSETTLVGMRDLIRQIPQSENHKKLLFTLGKDLMGNCVYGDMEKLTHLLIAGATGSGKSVCVNAIVTSIIMRARPDEVKILLIDPKKVEFTQFSNIPHLIAPVITSAEEASRALEVVVEMMDKRYELFSKLGVRNITSYNELVDRNPGTMKKLPKVLVIIDELADLMLVAAKDVEARIQRITQLARAAGIHLIVATQRPSVDVITGLIKANIPSRIAFAVSSAVDSRTILDQQGAEKLLGNGDMLYIPRGENSPVRVQGCYVSDDEVVAVADYCSKQAKPQYEDAFINLAQVDASMGVEASSDPLYEDVKQFVIESKKASTSFIQRKFSIGYSRAARLIDQLEANGIIGPANGSKPREVYVRFETNDVE